jgi:hypothetical protein
MDGAALGTAAVIAAFLMPVISLLKKPTWSTSFSHVVALVAALIAAVAGAYVDGSVHTVGELVPYMGTAFATSQTLYTLYFSKTEVNAKLESIGS